MKYLLPILFVFLQICHHVVARQKVVLLLADGLRWDRYLEDLPNLMKIEQNGVRAEWMDGVFVTLSCPSMYSIATGLYPESHGAIHNLYFDPVTGDRTFNYFSTLNVTEWFDTGAEPVWVTAILNGLKAGSIMYPGGSVPIKGIKPTKSLAANAANYRIYRMKDRIDEAITWLLDDDLDIVFIYFDNPDAYLHAYGIGANNSTEKLYEVDSQIGYLVERLSDTGLDQNTNLIVASDHGHANVEKDNYVILSDYVDIAADVDFLIADYGPMFQMVPKNESFDKVYSSLKNAHPAMHVYKRAEIPERLHYRDNPRILPLIGFMDPGWHMHSRRSFHPIADVSSDHGFDNKWMLMKSSFYAQGPFFRKNYRAPVIESVDLYNLMCEILDIEPAPNNGSRDRYVTMLTQSQPTTDTMTTYSAASKLTSAALMTEFIVLLNFVLCHTP